MPLNHSLFFFFYERAHQSPTFDSLVVFTAVWLGNILIALAALFIIFHRDSSLEPRTIASLKQKAKEALLVLVSAFAAWIVASVLKDLIGNLRPFDAFPIVRPLFPETGFSFPSGHATFFSALAVAVSFYHRKLAIAFGICAIFIGIARIIGGVHFPLDILGGFILGPIVVFFSYRFLRWFGRRYGLL